MTLHYNVPGAFDFAQFLAACSAGGVPLESGEGAPAVGSSVLVGLVLTVDLDDAGGAAVVTAAVEAQGGAPA